MAEKVLSDPSKQKYFEKSSLHELFELPKQLLSSDYQAKRYNQANQVEETKEYKEYLINKRTLKGDYKMKELYKKAKKEI